MKTLDEQIAKNSIRIRKMHSSMIEAIGKQIASIQLEIKRRHQLQKKNPRSRVKSLRVG